MAISDFLQRFSGPGAIPTSYIVAGVAASIASGLAILSVSERLQSRPRTSRQIIPSPRATQIPGLTKEEQAALPYPPDVFPGSRDVESPV